MKFFDWLKAASLSVFFGLSSATVLAPAMARADGPPAQAQQAAAAPTKLQFTSETAVDAKGKPVKGQLWLEATLTAADKPVTNEEVGFYERVDLIGDREAFLGSGTTDSTGRALIVYEPTVTGDQQITAQYGGSDQLAASDVSATIKVTDALPAFPPESAPLGSVAQWLAVGVVVLVMAVWTVLLAIFFRTTLGIRAAARLVVVGERAARPGSEPEFVPEEAGLLKE